MTSAKQKTEYLKWNASRFFAKCVKPTVRTSTRTLLKLFCYAHRIGADFRNTSMKSALANPSAPKKVIAVACGLVKCKDVDQGKKRRVGVDVSFDGTIISTLAKQMPSHFAFD